MRYEPEYGVLKLVLKEYGHGTTGTTFTEFETRPCNEEELGLGSHGYTDPKSKFYQMTADHDVWFLSFYKKLQCTDVPLDVSGNFNSNSIRHLQIHLVKCDSSIRGDCKSDEEITEWLRRKFIIVMTNNERFDSTVYTDDRVVRESLFYWHPVKSTLREEIVNPIQ